MSGRWRALPDSLDPEIAYLVAQLRTQKDRSGLSLAALAARTAYSKSSWDRYLNGVKLPPRHAVEALAQLAGEPVERMRALWEQADARWSGRAAQAQPTDVPQVVVPESPAPESTVPESPVPESPVPESPVPEFTPDLAAEHPAWRRVLPGVLTGCAGAALLVVVAAGLGVFDRPAVPGYSVGCHAAQCAGREAEGMACGIDAASFADLRVADADLELRISDRCQAAWARISRSEVGDRVSVEDREGRTQTVTVADQAATEQYVPTPMLGISRHFQVRACVDSRAGRRACTPWGADQQVSVSMPLPTSR